MLVLAYGFVFAIVAMTLRDVADSRRRKKSRHTRGRVAQREVMPAEMAAPRRQRQTIKAAATPTADNQLRSDVISALKNLQYSAKDSKATVERATGETFSDLLKNSLALLAKDADRKRTRGART